MKKGGNDITLYHGDIATQKAFLGVTEVYNASQLPYDAQVEYLETPASDNGYIAIPCNVTNGCVITIDGYIGVTNRELFSLPLNGVLSSTSYQFNIETGATYYRFFFTSAINAGSNNISVRHTWKCGTSLYKDDVLIGSETPTLSDTRDGIWVFRGTHGYAKGRIYSLKFDDENNGIHIDCIPVRVGQVGYLYDKVNGQLFGNAGSGAFTYGNDV